MLNHVVVIITTWAANMLRPQHQALIMTLILTSRSPVLFATAVSLRRDPLCSFPAPASATTHQFMPSAFSSGRKQNARLRSRRLPALFAEALSRKWTTPRPTLSAVSLS